MERPELAPSILVAALIVSGGIVAGLLVGGAFRSPTGAGPSPTASVMGAESTSQPTPRQTLAIRSATPKPSRTSEPSPEPSFAIPTPGAPGETGIPPPLPRIAMPGGDPAVAAALEAAIEGIDRLRTFRFRTNLSGRSLADLSSGGLDLGTDGSLVTEPVRSIDLILGVRMVEFECSAATSSSSRYVVVGTDAWSEEDGVLEAVPDGTWVQFIDEMTPAGLARRVLAPFVEGYERVGAEAYDGRPATRYRATAMGIHAYAAVTGIVGEWSADAWVAESGVLLGLRIEGRGDGPCDGFLAEIALRDIDDAAIVIPRPS